MPGKQDTITAPQLVPVVPLYEAAQNLCKVLFENDRVRVLDTPVAEGERISWSSPERRR